MSAKNCEETPRQKMIGMMYLVLTAMLALNVSSDVLNAFSKVQAGLTQTVINYDKKNNQVYADFENSFTLNKSKVKPWRDKALKVKAKSDDLYDYIEELKWEVVRKADGEDADLTNILSKDNQDVSAEVMITFGKAKVLKSIINEYKDYLLSLVCDKNPVLCKSIEANLNTLDPPVIKGEIQTWASSNFENMPLAAVVTLMTKLQVDVKNAESDVISLLYKNIDKGSFKFNSLSAHVIPESRYILKGGKYTAKILLAAIDTTQRPVVVINGNKVVKHKGDASLYEVNCNTVGVHKWKGIVKYTTPTGETNVYQIEDEYIVASPNVVVSPLKMNVFYLGVDNPVRISVPGIASENIQVRITNGSIVKKGSDYVVRPKRAGVICDITVCANNKNKLSDIGSLKFRVKTVPDPVAKLAGKKGGDITKSLLSASGGVSASLEEFDFDMKFRVIGFNLYTIGSGGYVKEALSPSARFSKSQKQIINNLKRGQRVIIDNIKAKGPDGRIRKLQSVTFKII